MRILGSMWLLLAMPWCTPDPVREEYLRLVRERDSLEQENKKLALEEKVLQEGQPYLIIDLEKRQIRAKLAGVLLRSAAISWWTRKPVADRCCNAFPLAANAEEVELEEVIRLELPLVSRAQAQVVPGDTVQKTPRDGSQAVPKDSIRTTRKDSGQVARRSRSRGTPKDSLLAVSKDSALAISKDSVRSVQQDTFPEIEAEVRSTRLSLAGGPQFWLHSQYPAADWLDSLVAKGRAWLRILPDLATTENYHLFLPLEEVNWIQRVATKGTWVLVFDCARRSVSRDSALEVSVEGQQLLAEGGQ